jgi:DNA-binding XRE family transcriptional regulator
MTTRPFDEIKREILSDPEVKQTYDELDCYYQAAALLLKMPAKVELTQGELAKLIGTKQASISRIERGNQNVSLEMLQKIATATGHRLKLDIIPV